LSSNVVEASWQALVDSVEFKLHKDNVKPRIRPPATTNGTRRTPKSRVLETIANGVAAKP
jgi:hypothetical protein